MFWVKKYLNKYMKKIWYNNWKNKFKYSLIKDPSETSSLEYIKQQNITVSFFIQLTIVSVC